MLGERWITDTAVSERFPYYTRANADEVGPMPFSPLGWDLGWAQGTVLGVMDGYCSFGAFDPEEFVETPPEVFGCWGGYFYNELSVARVMGARMPGATPEAIDNAYFGDHPGVPPYKEHPDDQSAVHEGRLGETMAWVMSVDGPWDKQEQARETALAFSAARPDLSAMTDAQLVAYVRTVPPVIRQVWEHYCEAALGASLPSGAIQAICAALERPGDAVKLMAAVGGIDSAEQSRALWELGRLVRGSDELTAVFDAGVAGLLDRVRASDSPDAAAFLAAVDDMLDRFGHRGPNEWDMMAHSWGTKPELALSMVERLRLQEDDAAPDVRSAALAVERERLAAELLELVKDDAETHGTLAAALQSAGWFFGYRERGKDVCIRMINEGKLPLYELGRRMVDAGVIDDVQRIFMLQDKELDAFVADPASFSDTIAERHRDFERLHELEPPYIITHEGGAPPISEWVERGTEEIPLAGPGDVLQGAPGAPGVATGVARVILDPSDPTGLEPGEIMVAPTTDPSWTPLFLSAKAVVVNVGAVASHAAIVSRELGVPCAVSVVQATSRIPDGATITVDGSTGTVTIDAVP